MPSQAFDYSSSEDGQFHTAIHKQLNVAIATDSVKMTLMAATQLAAAADLAEALRNQVQVLNLMMPDIVYHLEAGQVAGLMGAIDRATEALKLFDS